jgi:DNA uptake protein ComE-like DNA-binding protein
MVWRFFFVCHIQINLKRITTMIHWKEKLYFTRAERIGIILTICIICCLAVAIILFNNYEATDSPDDNSLSTSEVNDFLSSVARSDSAKRHRYEKREYIRRTITLRPFDPNTADSAAFVSLGLQPWMASNIMKYRSKGGRFRRADDFAKVYGLSAEQFAELRPFITIAGQAADTTRRRDTLYITSRRDSVFKYPAGTMLPINASDTTELKKIPGVGSAIARSIVSYRNRLGGFYSLSQLADIHLNADLLGKWLTLDTVPLRQIDINRSSIERMRSHPYISFYMAKAIKDYRDKYGNIRSMQDLSLLDEFSAADIERISHYVTF